MARVLHRVDIHPILTMDTLPYNFICQLYLSKTEKHTHWVNLCLLQPKDSIIEVPSSVLPDRGLQRVLKVSSLEAAFALRLFVLSS